MPAAALPSLPATVLGGPLTCLCIHARSDVGRARGAHELFTSPDFSASELQKQQNAPPKQNASKYNTLCISCHRKDAFDAVERRRLQLGIIRSLGATWCGGQADFLEAP